MSKTYKIASSWLWELIQKDYFYKASALTFYSLMSIVPILAVAFGIAKGFGFEQSLQDEILQRFQEQQEVAQLLIKFAYSLLQHVQGGIIAGIGIIFLFWSILTLLSNIENTMNDIWNVRETRSLARRFGDYLAIMLICPIVFFISSSLTVFISTQLTETAKNYHLVQAISPYFFLALRFSPFVLSWILLSFLYLFVPNTKVSFVSGIAAGILAGTAFQLWQWLYIYFQSSISSYGAIYGSFAALPLFLFWLQYSWLIVLAGAQIAFQLENELWLPAKNVKTPYREVSGKTIALLITYHCMHAFSRGEPPITDHQLIQLTGTPLNHIRTILGILQQAHLLIAVKSGYQPARDIHTMTIKNICDAVEKNTKLEAPIQDSEVAQEITTYLDKLDATVAMSKDNVLLYTIKTHERYDVPST